MFWEFNSQLLWATPAHLCLGLFVYKDSSLLGISQWLPPYWALTNILTCIITLIPYKNSMGSFLTINIAIESMRENDI